jgi:predicted PurR-regulated permease PerM
LEKSIFRYGTIFCLLIASAVLFVPFFVTILFAAVCAFALQPYLDRMSHLNFFRNRNCTSLAVVGLFLGITIPILATIYRTYDIISDMDLSPEGKKTIIKDLIKTKQSAFSYIENLLYQTGLSTKVDLSSKFEAALARGGDYILGFLTRSVTQIPEFLFYCFVFVIVLFLFLSQSKVIKHGFLRSGFVNRRTGDVIVKNFQVASQSALLSSIFTGLVQALIVATGASLLGAADFIIVFVITFLVSFIPLIGAGPVAIALSIPYWFNGHVGIGIAFLGLALFAGVIDNILRPYFISSAEVKIHPIISLLSILGGIIVFGAAGLFIGPVIVSISVSVIPILFKELMPHPHQPQASIKTHPPHDLR